MFVEKVLLGICQSFLTFVYASVCAENMATTLQAFLSLFFVFFFSRGLLIVTFWLAEAAEQLAVQNEPTVRWTETFYRLFLFHWVWKERLTVSIKSQSGFGSVQFSPLTDWVVVGTWFSRDCLRVFPAEGQWEQFWNGQGCPIMSRLGQRKRREQESRTHKV